MNKQNKLSLLEIKAKIPKHCFDKSLPRSLFYMCRDLLLLSTAFYTYAWFSQSWLGLFTYWNIYGFLMWCLFVVGHDCGHKTFSKYNWVNDLCGHICHGVLLVPFWSWAYSHKLHHQHHHHYKEDRSFPWLTQEEWKNTPMYRKIFLYSPIAPFLTVYFYLFFGIGDGSHIYPGRLYVNASNLEKIKCLASTTVITAFAIFLLVYTGSVINFFLFYGGCWLMFSFWLFLVTYMQHHTENSIAFDDENWNYLDGALEAVDRKYGFGIDDLHHNITDCHVVHHLFFSQIPHYHLKEATQHIKKDLEERGLYHHAVQSFFLYDFFKLFYKAHLTNWTFYKP